MDEGMTSSADIDAPLFHVRFIEVLFEPFVAMTASRYQVMKGNRSFATAKRTFFTHGQSEYRFLL
jgi:hypothetical protein